MVIKKIDFKELEKVFNECFEISKKKNADYGCQTMLDFMEKGLVIRLNDKMSRLKNLIWENKEAKVKDEKIEDTAKDMINYAAYLILILRKKLVDKNE